MPSTQPEGRGTPGASRAASVGATILAGLAGGAIFLGVHPYEGLFHDATLYAVQALSRLDPSGIGRDLAMTAGVDRLSVFPALYALLIDAAGLAEAAAAVTILSLVMLFAATWALLSGLAGARIALLGVVLVALWPVPYGAARVFFVAEPFATSRTLAAALALLALAFAVRGCLRAAFAGGALAAALHPLMAMPAAILLGTRVLSGRTGPFATRTLGPRVVIAMLLVAGVALVIAFTGTPLDPPWGAVVQQRVPYLLPSSWTKADWSSATVAVTTPLLAGLRMQGDGRRLFLGSAAIGAAGVMLTLAGCEGLGSAAVCQAQPWRALWLAHWLGLLGGAALFARFLTRPRDPRDGIAFAGVVGAELATAATGGLVSLAALAALIGWREGAVARSRLLGAGAWLLLAQALAWRLLEMPSAWSISAAMARASPVLVEPLRDTLLLGAASLAAFAGASRFPASVAVSCVAATLLMAGAGALEVRRTIARDQALILAPGERDAVRAAVPPGGSVLWGEDTPLGWFGAGTPAYLSPNQTAGVVFSRDFALEARRRAAHLEGVLGPQPDLRWRLEGATQRRLAVADVPALCADPALSAVFVRGASEDAFGDTPDGRPALRLRDARGVTLGRLVSCNRPQR